MKNKEFQLREEALEVFLKELKELFKSHKISTYSIEEYTNDDEYAGTEYVFVVDGETLYHKTINDVLETF